MKQDEVMEFFKATLSECREGMKSARKVWDENMRWYTVSTPFSKEKQSWQFRIQTPFAKPKTRRATSIIKSILFKGEDRLDFDTPRRSQNDPQYRIDLERCNFTKRWLKAHLNSKVTNFYDQFSEALEAAFGYSGIMIIKMWVGDAETKMFDPVRDEIVSLQHLALKTKAIDPYLFDCSADETIQIEHEFVTLPEVFDLVDSGVFDKKLSQKLTNSDYIDPSNITLETKERLRRIGINDSKNEYRKEVKLSHYWGPIINKNGKFEGKMKKFTVANESFMLTPVMDSPYYDGSTPYIIGKPFKIPFSPLGKSLTQDVNGIESAIRDFVCMQCDNLLWRMLGITEMDQRSVDAKTKRELSGLYPGQVILRSPGLQQVAIQQHELGFDPTQATPIIEELKALHDQDHGVTDYLSGTAIGGEATATEWNSSTSAALGLFETTATNIEHMLVRCYDKGRDLLVQYMSDPQYDPSAVSIMGEEGAVFDQMSAEERRAVIVSEYNIVARGVSIFFEKLKKMNSYTGIYKILAQAPPDAVAWINWENFWKDVFDVLGLDSTQDKIKTQEQMQQEQQAQQQQQQEQMQQEMQKIMAPLQIKLQQTQMGVEERTQKEMALIQRDQEKQNMQSQLEMQKLQIKYQAELQRIQMEHQAELQKMQAQHQLDMQKQEMKSRSDTQDTVIKLRADMEKKMLELETKNKEIESKMQLETIKIATS